MVGGLQIKIQCLRCGGIAAHEVGSEQLTVARHAGRARSTGEKEDQLSQDSSFHLNNRNIDRRCPVQAKVARVLLSELGLAG
jgi:hypothetical protein